MKLTAKQRYDIECACREKANADRERSYTLKAFGQDKVAELFTEQADRYDALVTLFEEFEAGTNQLAEFTEGVTDAFLDGVLDHVGNPGGTD